MSLLEENMNCTTLLDNLLELLMLIFMVWTSLVDVMVVMYSDG